MTTRQKNTTLQIRISNELKDSAESVFEELGLNTSQAISIFLKQVVLTGAIPFRIGLPKPNARTLEAISEIDAIINGEKHASYLTKEELFNDLGI